jgi:hypothetical protein
MRSIFKSVVVVLAFALSLSVATPFAVHAQPTVAISGRQIEPPDFSSIVKRFFRQLKHFFGSEPDADSISVPRP